MIELTIHVRSSHFPFGGASVSYQSSSANHYVSPTQVWARLTVECQMRIIRLMAQLAFKLVADQSPFIKESDHVVPDHTQNPT
jgi:hypothetical protein